MKFWVNLRKIFFSVIFSILTLLFPNIVNAQTVNSWTFTAPTQNLSIHGNNFYPVAMSSDGKYMYSAAHAQGLYISLDYGKTWNATPNFIPQDYWGLISSADGHFVAGIGTSGLIVTSSDYGQNFTDRTMGTPLQNIHWGTITADSTAQNIFVGSQVVGGSPGAGAYVSHDSGVTWTQVNGLPTDQTYWASASSADGKYVYFAGLYDGIYSSSDYGVTWTKSLAPASGYLGLKTSADGKYLLAAMGDSNYLQSTDYGLTWNQTTLPGNQQFYDSAISATGQYQALVSWAGDIFTSIDYGQTWVNQTQGKAGSGLNYPFAAMSANGQYILASTENMDLWVGENDSVIAEQSNPTSTGPKSPNTGNGSYIDKSFSSFYVIGFISVLTVSLIIVRYRIKQTR